MPAARAAGVRTPALVAYDDACDLLPVPYLIVEGVAGKTLGSLDLEPGATPDVWRSLGRDLALLHTGVGEDGPTCPVARPKPLPDPRELVGKRASDGWYTTLEARWLSGWLDRLAAAASEMPAGARFLHLDVQTTNVMVHPELTRLPGPHRLGLRGVGRSCLGLLRDAAASGAVHAGGSPQRGSARRRRHRRGAHIVATPAAQPGCPATGRRPGHVLGGAAPRLAAGGSALLPPAARSALEGAGASYLVPVAGAAAARPSLSPGPDTVARLISSADDATSQRGSSRQRGSSWQRRSRLERSTSCSVARRRVRGGGGGS